MKLDKNIQGKLNHTFNTGIFLLMNAIPDICLYLDGPKCNYEKTMSIEKAHDMFSDIMQRDGYHRILCGGIGVERYIHNQTEVIFKQISKILEDKRFNGVMVLPFTMSLATAFDYENIINRLQNKYGSPIFFISSETYEKDWVGAYDSAMLNVIQKLDFKKGKEEKEKVILVGHLFDRWEGDNLGNIKEMKRLLSGINLEVEVTLLDGRKLKEYPANINSNLIISMPYGKRTANYLSKKLNLDLLEVDLPIGLKSTEGFIKKIAAKTNQEEKANKLITDELSSVIPKIDKILPSYIINKNFIISGDQYLGPALMESIKELGGQTKKLIIIGDKLDNNIVDCEVLMAPYYTEIYDMDISTIDYIVANSQIKNIMDYREDEKKYNFVNIGYPSEYFHCFTENAYFGFQGLLNLLNRIVNSK